MNKILKEFSDITVWERGEQRAPHKPLLILYAMGALLRGEEKILFSDTEKPLTLLLKEFGPQRKSYHPEYPFWRLQNDGIWFLENGDNCEMREGSSNAKISELRKNGVSGHFREDLVSAFKADTLLVSEIVKLVLDNHFPETLHGEIQEACGITLEFSKRNRRDPNFREKVLRAYQYRCGVCGFQAQMDGRHLALEAAHIKWHAAGGPDVESNGIAMCSLHHKLFDKGAFMFKDSKLLVSESVYGTSSSFEALLLSRHGQVLERPIREEYVPEKEWLTWHATEVFRGPVRAV